MAPLGTRSDKIPCNHQARLCFVLLFLLGAYFMLPPVLAEAAEFTSSNFKVIDPIISVGGGRSTSAAFGVEQSVGEPIVGNLTSASFGVRSGFLTFSAPSAIPAAAAAETATIIGGGGLFLPSTGASKIVRCSYGFRPADLNCDGTVGLQDLSIFLYNFPRTAPNPVDLNKDKVVDIKDLSILLYSWNQKLLTFLPDSSAPAMPATAEIQPQEQFAFVGKAAPVDISAHDEEQEEGSGQKISSILRDVISFVYEIMLRAFGLLRFLFWQEL